MKRFGVSMTLVLLIAIMGSGYVGPGFAQAEDDCILVEISGASGSSVCENGLLAVWDWTAPATGTFIFDTEGSDGHTLLSYCDALGVCRYGGEAGEVRISAQQGQDYGISVLMLDSGTIVLNWRPASAGGGSRVSNDDFASSTALSGASGRSEGSNVGAGKESDEPAHAGDDGGASVWWTWTAPATGPVTFDTNGSDFDTLLAVYTISRSSWTWTEVAANDDSDVNSWSEVRFNAQQGQAYHVVVDGWDGETGAIVLNWRAASPEDDCLSLEISGASGSSVCENGLFAVWTWTAPTTDTFVFDTEGSDFDTRLAYDDLPPGPSMPMIEAVARAALSQARANELPPNSKVRISAQQGQLYAIGATSADDSSDPGTLVLNWRLASPGADDFAARPALSGASGQGGDDNGDAGKESGEPNHAGNSGGASLWWTWTAPATGPVTFDTRGSDFDTLLAIYTGARLNRLTAVASNDDVSSGGRQSEVSFTAQRGQTYHVAVDGHGGATGTIVLNWRSGRDPASPDLVKVSLSGIVSDDATDAAIAGATISVTQYGDGVAYQLGTTATDDEGAYEIEIAAALGRINVKAEAERFTPQSAVVNVMHGTASAIADFVMLPVSVVRQFPPTDDVDIRHGGRTVVSVPPDSLTTEDGSAPAGSVTARVTVFDDAADMAGVSGDYRSLDTETKAIAPVDPFGAVDVRFEDDKGRSLNAKPGNRFVITIKLVWGSGSGAAPPPTTPLFWWSDEKGAWVEAGEANLTGGPGQYAYTGQASHGASWMAGTPFGPEVVAEIRDMRLIEGKSASLFLSDYFRHPEGGPLYYRAEAENKDLLATVIIGDTLTVRALVGDVVTVDTQTATATVRVTACLRDHRDHCEGWFADNSTYVEFEVRVQAIVCGTLKVTRAWDRGTSGQPRVTHSLPWDGNADVTGRSGGACDYTLTVCNGCLGFAEDADVPAVFGNPLPTPWGVSSAPTRSEAAAKAMDNCRRAGSMERCDGPVVSCYGVDGEKDNDFRFDTGQDDLACFYESDGDDYDAPPLPPKPRWYTVYGDEVAPVCGRLNACGDDEPAEQPVAGIIPAQSVTMDETLTLDLSTFFTYSDPDMLEYAVTCSPETPWHGLNRDSGYFHITPTPPTAPGTYNCEAKASDDVTGAKATATFQLTIKSKPVRSQPRYSCHIDFSGCPGQSTPPYAYGAVAYAVKDCKAWWAAWYANDPQDALDGAIAQCRPGAANLGIGDCTNRFTSTTCFAIVRGDDDTGAACYLNFSRGATEEAARTLALSHCNAETAQTPGTPGGTPPGTGGPPATGPGNGQPSDPSDPGTPGDPHQPDDGDIRTERYLLCHHTIGDDPPYWTNEWKGFVVGTTGEVWGQYIHNLSGRPIPRESRSSCSICENGTYTHCYTTPCTRESCADYRPLMEAGARTKGPSRRLDNIRVYFATYDCIGLPGPRCGGYQ